MPNVRKKEDEIIRLLKLIYVTCINLVYMCVFISILVEISKLYLLQ
jgi:hypothetical protein